MGFWGGGWVGGMAVWVWYGQDELGTLQSRSNGLFHSLGWNPAQFRGLEWEGKVSSLDRFTGGETTY